MELRQAETLRMLDHHQRRVRHVHADLDHGGCHQHLDLAPGKGVHHLLLLGGFQAAVHQADLQVWQRLDQRGMGFGRSLQLQRFGFFDQRTYPIDLAAFERGGMHPVDDFVAPDLVDHARDDWRAAGRQLIDHRHFQIGVIRHGQRARDRRGRHHQLVRHGHPAIGRHGIGQALVAQRQALADAETVLLVDDHQSQPGELHCFLDQRMRADDQLRLAGFDGGLGLGLVLLLQAAGEPDDLHAKWCHPAGDVAEMLVRQDLGGRHQHCLEAAVDGLRCRQRGDHRLAAADIALQQALHRKGLHQVGPHFCQYPLLRRRQLERQGRQECLRQAAEFRQCCRALGPACKLGALERELLRQQLVELHAYPRRMRAFDQRCFVDLLGRIVQQPHRRFEGFQLQPLAHRRRQRVGPVDPLHGVRNRAPQDELRYAFAGRIDRRQRTRQRCAFEHHLVLGMHHLRAEKAMPHLGAGAYPVAFGKLPGLAAVEVQEAQHQRAGIVGNRHHQLPAWPELHRAGSDDAFDLGRPAEHEAGLGDRHDLRFVFVPQRQVQHQVHVRTQAEPRQLVSKLFCAGGSRCDGIEFGGRRFFRYRHGGR